MRGEIAPEIATMRLINIWNFLKKWVAVSYDTFKVIAALTASIVLLPGLLKVIGPNGGIGPYVPIA